MFFTPYCPKSFSSNGTCEIIGQSQYRAYTLVLQFLDSDSGSEIKKLCDLRQEI